MRVTNGEKESVRREMLLRMRTLAPEYVQAASACFREMLRPLLEERRHICLYASLPHEIDLLPLLHEQPEHCYYFPRCLPGRQMSFHRVQVAEKELVPGAMGIRAPLPSLPAISPQDIELVVLPGLAFEPLSSGGAARLGYGGGYYDRFLPLLSPAAHTVALALPEQLVSELPTAEHDVPVNTLLTL